MSEAMADAGIQTWYAARFAADLEGNEKEQVALRTRLEQLEKEHAWLLGMRDAVAGKQDKTGGAAEGTGTAAAGGVPQPRRATNSVAAPGRRKEKSAQAKGAGALKAPGVRARKSGGPTLGELVLALLAGHRQPRMVGEVITELGQAHPERTVSAQVVRNTVEALVAKGRLERERKRGSVFYTATAAADSAPQTVPLAAVPEAGAGEEKAAEGKAPVGA
ncbi:hypothetical protein [Streptomyces olivoreticuli]|uniref:hypothetical protein n=1 Tax=Streptomyces olivoreticuli TaxID=68246 RepID=UPI000E255B5D|nr:hypothetical protein [Streptomyces olivoreticuli]